MATQLTDKASVEQIIQEMTVEEKARLVIGGTPFHSEAVPEYGIPAMFMLDSCNGMNMREYYGDMAYIKAAADAEAAGAPLDREKNGFMGGLLIGFTALQKSLAQSAQAGAPSPRKELGCYPPGISVGSSWNPEAAESCSSAMAREMGSRGIDMILGPNINIQRDPLCGRLGESLSEDPYLVSVMGPAQVRGIQSEGLLACTKHFAANNQEKDRLGVETHVSERALQEIYLPGFHACADAGSASFMSAYNKLNGSPSAMNKRLLTDILKEEWGYDGFVVSDWGASYDQVAAVAAGTDLTMPGPRGVKCIMEAVENGSLPPEKLDDSVRRILNALLRSTAMSGKRPEFHMEETVAAAEKLARESIILLKNDGTLPLNTDTDVAFYGKRSKKFVSCPEGSSSVDSDLITDPHTRAVELLGAEHVSFEASTPTTKYWIVTVGANGHEGSDREDMEIDADEKSTLEKAISEAEAAGGKVVVLVNATGPVALNEYEDRVSAILCSFFAGMQGGKVAADAIFGLVNPSGKLPMTWPEYYYDSPAYKNFPGENKEVWYGEGMYVGYRWYDARHIKPRYPFGYGLSYTSFALSELNVPDEVNIDAGELTVSVKVKNTGSVAGSEVVQVYIHDVVSKFDKPVKELKGFQKVFLEPGEEKSVLITLNKCSFAGYCLEFGEWVTEPGEFEIMVGTSAGDLPLVKRINVRCKDPFGLSWRTGIGVIAKNPKAVEVINRVIEANILDVANVAIQYAPDKPFKEIWEGTAVKGLFDGKGMNQAEISRKFDEIMSAFDQLDN